MDLSKAKIIEVTTTTLYIVDPDLEEQMEREWFGTHINNCHAARDHREIGGSKTFVSKREITEEERKALKLFSIGVKS